MAKFSIEVNNGPEWDRTIAELRHQAKTLGDEIERAIKDSAKETVKIVKKEALEIPALSGRHTGVRARMARGVNSKKVPGGVRITTSMPADEHALARGFDNPTTGWFHPTFGDEPIQHQFPGTTDGWFLQPVSDDFERYEEAVENVLEDAVEIIAAVG